MVYVLSLARLVLMAITAGDILSLILSNTVYGLFFPINSHEVTDEGKLKSNIYNNLRQSSNDFRSDSCFSALRYTVTKFEVGSIHDPSKIING